VRNGGAEQWRGVLGEAEYRLAAAYFDCIESGLRAAASECGRFAEVAHYVIAAGGRRIRPLVTLATCDALAGKWPDAAQAAVAVELIHTASLIHDDILDGSQERRGQSAAHVKFGTNLALLTGDMLVFAALRSAQAFPGAAKALTAACCSMCLGEAVMDPIESARLKTGALFRAAAEVGALAAGAPQERITVIGQYGELLGTAYQLRDDELDAQRNVSPRRYADEALLRLAGLPGSSAKDLLVQLARFAWQRPK